MPSMLEVHRRRTSSRRIFPTTYCSDNGNSIRKSRPQQHSPVAAPAKLDDYYGHEYITRLRGCFITHLFTCQYLPSASHPQAMLPLFIAYNPKDETPCIGHLCRSNAAPAPEV